MSTSKKQIQKNTFSTGLALSVSVLFAFSCQKTQFAEVEQQKQQSSMATPVPTDPEPEQPVVTPDPPPAPTPIPTPTPVVPTPSPLPQPVVSKGACAGDSSTVLTSCQKCNVPANPPPPPQLSQKGQSLLDIMTIACSIPNKSAPKGYVPPTHDQLLARMNRLSPTLYPDSQMSSFQISVIQGLQSDSNLQRKMFGGLWYQPPYSDAYETYFGLSVAEAVYQVCYQSTDSIFTPYNTTELHSKTYIDCLYGSGVNCRETPEYVAANNYRNQLRTGMKESLLHPYVAPAPTPAKTCSWEKFEGLYKLGGAEQIGKWIVSGQQVSMEVLGAGGRCSLVSAIPTGADIPQGEVVISTYGCK